MKRWLRYGLIGAIPVTYGALWLALKDPIGALISLFALAIPAALLLALGVYLVPNLSLWTRRIRGVTPEAYLAQLESTGEATREHYQTHRALTAEDYSTSCLVHFIDIGEGKLLCLHGQS